MTPEEILKKPYARILLPNDDGVLTALILEFPGCISQGDTPSEAYQHLMDAAESWILAMQAQGNEIPEPFSNWDDDRRSLLELVPLWGAVEKWRDKYKPSCEESLVQSDRVNERLPELASGALGVVGYYEYED